MHFLYGILLSSASFLSLIPGVVSKRRKLKYHNFNFLNSFCSVCILPILAQLKQMVLVVDRFFSINFYTAFRVKFFSAKFTPSRKCTKILLSKILCESNYFTRNPSLGSKQTSAAGYFFPKPNS